MAFQCGVAVVAKIERFPNGTRKARWAYCGSRPDITTLGVQSTRRQATNDLFELGACQVVKSHDGQLVLVAMREVAARSHVAYPSGTPPGLSDFNSR